MGYTGEEVMGRNLVQEFISPDYGEGPADGEL
jgi:hypothetical protein